jgi:hypothetical protein
MFKACARDPNMLGTLKGLTFCRRLLHADHLCQMVLMMALA